MSNNRSRPLVFVLAAIVLLLLCGALLAGGFTLGRMTADADAPLAEPAASAAAETVNEVAEAQTVVDADTETPAEAEPPGVTAPEAGDPPVEQPEEVVQQPAPTQTSEPAPTEPPAADAPTAPVGEFEEDDLAILWEVWQLIKTQYDGEIPDDEDLAYAAIRGILEELGDPYTRFAEPELAERLREDLQGSFEGIGAFVRENDEGFTEIVRPIDGQPADRAGLQAGDVVLAVDGESMVGKSLDEVISLIRGPRGTEVTLTFQREGLEEPFEVTIVRDRIEIPIVESEMLEEGIAYVRLTQFSRNAEEQLALALEELLAQNPQGIILDLRDNPGGFLDQSVAVADLFLDRGVVLYERSTFYDIDQVYESGTGDPAESIPLVVLINAGSASASEIVAGAIQDRGRGTLIGEVTFGKGSVQLPHNLSDGSELRVTIARWYTPNNQSIDGAGVTPDIEVETPEDLGGETDTQLQRAIEFILTGE